MKYNILLQQPQKKKLLLTFKTAKNFYRPEREAFCEVGLNTITPTYSWKGKLIGCYCAGLIC